jgi:hypothetical protein
MKSVVAEVHIGNLIKSRAKAVRVGPTELGERIETSKQNVYGIFKRKSIDTELLAKICLALDHDFFAELSQAVAGRREGRSLPKKIGKQPGLNELGQDPRDREITYLRRLNGLLEEKLVAVESKDVPKN